MIYRKIPKDQSNSFYQAKFDYYRKVSGYCALITGLCEIMYFNDDCQLSGSFSSATLPARLSILIPMLLFIILAPRVKDYKKGFLLYYLIPHWATVCTIVAVYHLDNRTYMPVGLIIMHFTFLAVGLAMPVIYHIPMHALLFVTILLTDKFMHYPDLKLIISQALPVYIGVILLQLILENTFADAYIIRQQLETNSVSDRLTGIYNRFIINEITGTRSEKFKLRSNDVFILMLDIDYFKNVNDTYGHVAGDEILKFVAEQIKSQLYKTDYVIRWGGEEFIVLLVDYDEESAYKLAEKLRKYIKTIKNYICPITISIGVSKYNNTDNYHEAIDKADQALYYAKEHGRDQVVRYEDII